MLLQFRPHCGITAIRHARQIGKIEAGTIGHAQIEIAYTAPSASVADHRRLPDIVPSIYGDVGPRICRVPDALVSCAKSHQGGVNEGCAGGRDEPTRDTRADAHHFVMTSASWPGTASANSRRAQPIQC